MAKRLYSVLRLRDRYHGDIDVRTVVCETQQDEKDVIRNATNAGYDITNVVAAEDAGDGIFLNDWV